MVEPAGWSLDDAWDDQAAAARVTDAADRLNASEYAPPPTLSVLVAAARASSLRRFYPFTSHGQLCLSTGPARCSSDSAEDAPAFIARDDGATYVVYAGSLNSADIAPILVARNAQEAVAELERLLADWPPSA